MPVSFIHAADFHLGVDTRRFGGAGGRLEQAQFSALKRTLGKAADRNAAFLLICGDLFDSRQPRPAIISRTASIFEEFDRVPVYIIPGTHDFLSERSVLAPPRANWAPKNVRVLNDSKQSPLHLKDFDVFLYFRPNATNRSTRSPIAGIERIEASGVHIGLAHGSLSIGSASANDFPVEVVEIERSRLDYLALGHWHRPRIQRFGNTVAVYSGIPQPLTFSDPEAGSVFHVRVGRDSSCAPEPIETSTVGFKTISGKIYHPQDIKKLLETVPDPNTILKLALLCSDNCTERLEIDRIVEHAKSRYILVQEENQHNRQSNSPPSPSGEINQDLIDAYTAELERLREADNSERKTIYEKALKLGTKIIKGDV